MTHNNKLIKSLSSKFGIKALNYVNSSKIINEFPIKRISSSNSININSYKNKKYNYYVKEKNLKKRKHLIVKNKNKANILKSFSVNDILNSYKSTNNIDKEDNNNRPFSGHIYPCKTININKKFGFYSSLTLNIGRNINKYTKYKKNFSFNSKKRNKNLKLKNDDILPYNLLFKSPMDLLLEKKENEFNLKLSHKPIISNQKLLAGFMKKNFKYIRINTFNDNFYYIKSKLNNTTKSSQKKYSNQELPLKFDNEKYKIFNSISKKIKKQLLSTDKNKSIKKHIEQIKKEKNIMNKERISQLKEDIEDNKILYTPKNFLKFRKDTFSYYKLNQLIQKLNTNFTYRNRFILANKLNIDLDDYIK